MARHRPAFTLVELLVVVAVIATLIGVLIPTVGSARRSAIDVASASNLRQLGAGTLLYRTQNDENLPQMRVDGAGNPVTGSAGDNIGSLFGGKLGALPFFGIDRIGGERRPLNSYVWDGAIPDDDSPEAGDFELPIFEDPGDAGTNDPLLSALGADTSNLYDLLGSSYTLNDHAPDEAPGVERFPTLIPRDGGRMPRVQDITRTWMLGTHPIYNYDDGADRAMRWGASDAITATLAFLDGHVRSRIPVAEGATHTTRDYTFLPDPRWIEREFPGATEQGS